MKVKNIIKKATAIIDNNLFDAIEKGSVSELQQKEINSLVNCVNLTISNISSNYYKLYDVVEVENFNGIIPYSKITDKVIFDIVSIKNASGNQLFTVKTDGIYTVKGKLLVKYTYFPSDVDYDDEITCFPVKVSERVIVYGVLSEYLYIKGIFDEAMVWEERFKNEMRSVHRPQKNINLRKRNWN